MFTTSNTRVETGSAEAAWKSSITVAGWFEAIDFLLNRQLDSQALKLAADKKLSFDCVEIQFVSRDNEQGRLRPLQI